MVPGYASLYKDYEKLVIENDKLTKENRDLKYKRNLDYKELLIKNDKLSKEIRRLKYLKNLLEKNNQHLIERKKNIDL